MADRRRTGSVALAAASAVLLGGCGGSHSKPLTKAAYVKQVKGIGASLGKPLRKFTLDTTAKTARADLRTVQTDLRQAVTQLDGITPPPKVKAPTARLATALSEFADELDPIIAKLNGDVSGATAKVVATKGFKDIQSASDAIVSAGYPIASG